MTSILTRRLLQGMALTALLLSIQTGCSSRQFYESVQHSRQQECRRLPVWRQQDCLSLYETSFEEYQRQREVTEEKARIAGSGSQG